MSENTMPSDLHGGGPMSQPPYVPLSSHRRLIFVGITLALISIILLFDHPTTDLLFTGLGVRQWSAATQQTATTKIGQRIRQSSYRNAFSPRIRNVPIPRSRANPPTAHERGTGTAFRLNVHANRDRDLKSSVLQRPVVGGKDEDGSPRYWVKVSGLITMASLMAMIAWQWVTSQRLSGSERVAMLATQSDINKGGIANLVSIKVTMLGGRDLECGSRPQVLLKVGNQMRNTSSKDRESFIQWNESFEFSISSQDNLTLLCIDGSDYDELDPDAWAEQITVLIDSLDLRSGTEVLNMETSGGFLDVMIEGVFSTQAKTKPTSKGASKRPNLVYGPDTPPPDYSDPSMAGPLGPQVDKIFLKLFRSSLESNIGATSSHPKEDYNGIIDLVTTLKDRESDNATINATSRASIKTLFPPFLLPAFRATIAKIWPNFANRLTALATYSTTAWLMGPSKIEDVEGLPAGNGQCVHIERCRYLEESQCVSVCVHTCKVPTQQFFKDDMGLPTRIVPDYDTFACKFEFGVDPTEQDLNEACAVPCFSKCPSRRRDPVGDDLECPSASPEAPKLSMMMVTQDDDEEVNNEEVTQVGTQEYYAGFLSRGFQEKEERVAGDKVLIPTLKFVGGFAVVIGLLTAGFMASNGLL